MKLEDPFELDELHVKVQATNNEKTKGLAVLYIDARNVMERLDTVVGSESWRDEYVVLDDNSPSSDGKIAILCSLTVQGLTKQSVGEDKDYKSAESDALKRAAVKFGIARYLYQQGQHWFDLKDGGRYFKKSDSDIIKQIIGGKPSEKKETITQHQINELNEFVKGEFITVEEAREIVKKHGFESSSQITKADYDTIKKAFEDTAKAKGIEHERG